MLWTSANRWARSVGTKLSVSDREENGEEKGSRKWLGVSMRRINSLEELVRLLFIQNDTGRIAAEITV